MRLIEVVHDKGRGSFSRYVITTLRNDDRLELDSLRKARVAFAEEVAVSCADPRVGPHMSCRPR